MNIAFITSTHRWGGVKTWMLEFGNELNKLGHSCYYFASDKNFIKKARENYHISHIIKFGADYNIFAVKAFYSYFRKYKIDIIICNIYKEIRTAGIAAKLLAIPVIHRVGLVGDLKNKIDVIINHKLIVDKILVPCKGMKDKLVETFKFIKEQDVEYVYNGKIPYEKRSIMKTDPVRFVITSKVEETKGHKDLFEALLKLDKEFNINFLCDIYGEGELEGWLDEQIKKYKLDSKIRLKGFSLGLGEILPNYHFGILTSYSEGFPNVVLEYLAAGLPVISTNIACIPELIEESKNGFLYFPGNIDQLTKLLHKCCLMEKNCYKKMSLHAVNSIEKKFNLKKNAKLLSVFLEKIVRGE
ncbi:glycosyltransferase [Deferribacter autotrophicus]|uniref:Glycosyltransferase n=1 Tax=Deferribacter autotrophicus TaxID=500465 RepID=A0A5A8F6F3_9BACT|nr:glycosyltransferase [Deferribacter autotrophicus]KAA0259003.1 glycosyltransferase [Deferribacter autotrophicus]